MTLTRYQRKRNFDRTAEPRGGSVAPADGFSFVVQKHAASHLHYDFRLEHDGVLWSWAVPKGPSLDPSDKRLAIHVEDHPLEYASFEGTIPKGEYGGGTVMVWDRGAWDPRGENPSRGLQRGRLKFHLHGERLRGAWTLTRLRARDGDGSDERDQWLLIKSDDDEASRAGKPVTERFQTSVASGRTMREIGAGAPNPKAVKNGRAGPGPKGEPVSVSEIAGAKRAAMPREVSPQLCTLSDEVPEGDDWLHEIKFDGYRLLAICKKSGVTLRTRRGNDWTKKFPPLAEALAGLGLDSAIIDGEVAILDAGGVTSFQRLQNAIKARDFGDLVFYAFDLLFLGGYDLTRAPLIERKQALRPLLPKSDESMVRYSEHIRGRGAEVARNACDLNLEGVICKRADAPYEQKRSTSWLKVKCTLRQEFVIIGWTAPSGSRRHFGSLLLAAHDRRGRLVYTGRVGTGFTQTSLKDLAARLRPLARKTCPADEPPTTAERRGVHWVGAELVAEVAFTQWTDDGRLRHPSFHGLREDKDADSVRIEHPKPIENIEMNKPTKQPQAKAETRTGSVRTRGASNSRKNAAVVAGVTLTHPDRVLYPDQGATKLDIARYYERIAPWILPYLIGRPLSTVRCPRGREGECFFQKHPGETLGEPVRSIRVKESDGQEEDYIAVDSVAGLVTLVQFGVLELHPWGATEADLETPDMLTFDLDPGEGVEFAAIRDAATLVRDELESLGLVPFLKTSGGKGLHVVVPLTPGAGWSEAKDFCASFAKRLAAGDPDQLIATASKAQRRGKIFIDYLRNSRGSTSVAPYSTRARAGAPVAAPLRWDELARVRSSDQYTIENVLRRLSGLKEDPWNGFERSRRKLVVD